ncbi:MAG: hypothetical protein VKJ06_02345 [Vampirovibrionales bacterium]|nr:hypothetical protein [Vampirovibrionales bacterium]
MSSLALYNLNRALPQGAYAPALLTGVQHPARQIPISSVFSASSQDLTPFELTTPPLTLPKLPLPSTTQAITLLSAGFASGFLLGQRLHGQRLSGPLEAQAQKLSPLTTPSTRALKSDASKILFLLNKPLYSLGNLFEKKPAFRQPLALYAAIAGVGFLGSTVLQGTQEAWIRLQESMIRAQLLGHLTRVFGQSITKKQQFDAQLQAQAQQALAQTLKQQGIHNPYQWIHCAQAGVGASPPPPDFLVPYQPTHRQPYFASGTAVNNTPETLATLQPSWLGKASSAVLLALGIVSGLIAGTLLPAQNAPFTGKAQNSLAHTGLANNAEALKHKAKTLEEAVTVYDLEAMVTEKAYLKDWAGMSGILAVGTLMGTAKLGVEALKQVGVTQANAQTEYQYQRYNWLELDPAFHATAEQAALQQQLNQFRQELPAIKPYPGLTVQRMSHILNGIGYNSAPKYFAMTPPVGLVDARG